MRLHSLLYATLPLFLLTSSHFHADETTNPMVSEQLDIRIPVVDMQDFFHPERREQFLETLYQAMTKIGFFAVRNTGVDSQIIKQAYAQAEQFFKQSPEYKEKSFVKHLEDRGICPRRKSQRQ